MHETGSMVNWLIYATLNVATINTYLAQTPLKRLDKICMRQNFFVFVKGNLFGFQIIFGSFYAKSD